MAVNGWARYFEHFCFSNIRGVLCDKAILKYSLLLLFRYWQRLANYEPKVTNPLPWPLIIYFSLSMLSLSICTTSERPGSLTYTSWLDLILLSLLYEWATGRFICFRWGTGSIEIRWPDSLVLLQLDFYNSNRKIWRAYTRSEKIQNSSKYNIWTKYKIHANTKFEQIQKSGRNKSVSWSNWTMDSLQLSRQPTKI